MSQRRYGAVLSYVSLALNLAVAFVLTPILVHALGKGQYGLFSLASSIVAYFLLADVGLNDTVLRYIVRYMRTGREELGLFIGVAIAGYVVIVIALIGLAAVGYTFLTPQHWPRLTPAEIVDLKFLYVVGVASVCAVLLTNPFGAIMAAHQRFIAIQAATIVSRALSAILVVAYLRFGDSVRMVLVLNTVVQVAVCFFQVVYVLAYIRPPMRLKPVPLSYVREKLNFAGPIFIVVMVEMIYWRLDIIIIGSMIGTVGIAVYSVGMQFQKYFQRLATTLSKVWIPKLIASLETGFDPEATTMHLVRIARLQALIILPILGGVIFFGQDFLRLWLGPDFHLAYPIMLLTLIPYGLEVVGNVRNTVLQVRGLYWRRAIAIVVFAALNVAVTIALIPRMGIVGGAIGTAFGLLCGFVYVQWLMTAKADYLPWRFYTALLKGIWIVIPAMTGVALALHLWPTASWLDLIVKGAIFGAAYVALVWVVGMNRTERGYFIGFARDAGLVRP